MSTLPGFDDDRPPQAARLAPKLRELAGHGVYFGTSSWKYPGWLGSVYSPSRYETRGKFSRKKFDETCLKEYAEVFPVVCGDFAFYQFPSDAYWSKLFGETPDSLSFAFKVPEDVTAPVWPKHARYGVRAGKPNEGFLDPTIFRKRFADRLAPYRDRVATIIFEFGTMAKGTFADAGAFLERLDPFLAALPEGWRYSVEIRNPEYLRSDYLATLASHNIAHVFNAWTRAPELLDQAAMEGPFTADFTVVRALLKRGRAYDAAVQSFEPYDRIQEPNEGARAGMVLIAEHALRRKKPAFLFVNNRLEGNAPSTIEAVIESLAGFDFTTDS
jgi:uncharacterized protein YecE (DUF72 family)